MHQVVLIIHLILAVALVGVILIQRSEGGGLGIGGGQGGMGAFASARGAANFLTRLTAYLATGFIVTSLTLAIMAGANTDSKSILDVATETVVEEVGDSPAEVEPAVPASQ